MTEQERARKIEESHRLLSESLALLMSAMPDRPHPKIHRVHLLIGEMEKLEAIFESWFPTTDLG